MSETATTSATASGTAPVAAKTPRTPGLINKRQGIALLRAEQTARAGQHPERVELMAARGITTDILESVVDDVIAAREIVASIVNSSTARKVASAGEKQASKDLIAGLREVQKAAKQKHARHNRPALDDYFVGKNLNGSRPNLLQISQAIIDKLAVDSLPGFTAAKIKRLKDARTAWVDADSEQLAHGTAATTARAELKTMLKSIEDRRLAIQLAADAEWPHSNAEHAGIRRAFAMPTKAPVKV